MKWYRVDSGYKHDRNTTALDVVEHEEENGYLDLYPTVGRLWLATISANKVKWYTKNIEDALRYSYNCSLGEVDCYNLYDFVVIAEDNELGYLVVDLS